MLKDLLIEARPFVEEVYSLVDELEASEKALKQTLEISYKIEAENKQLFQDNQKLKVENYNLQMFIEEHATEEQKEKIFKQSDKE